MGPEAWNVPLMVGVLLAPVEQIEALLDPLETAVSHLPRLDLTQEQAKLFLNGNPLWSEDLPLEDIIYAVYFEQLIGICKGNLITKVLK